MTILSRAAPQPQKASTSGYIGRFAPSPSGPLHFGSLVCALASYLDAKANEGRWLVRIEDIDPPREQAGADKAILGCLQQHGLHWDGAVLYQSTRSKAYLQALSQIQAQGLSYYCTCNRKRLMALGGCYDGKCRNQHEKPEATASRRLNSELALGVSDPCLTVQDAIQGPIHENFSTSGDIIIHRKDGLFAYQLAVSVDDIAQNITHVVRGCDLLDATPKQALIMNVLKAREPHYAHIPVIVDSDGRKLSKQNHAAAVDTRHAFENVQRACHALALVPPSDICNLDSLLAWAISAWDLQRLINRRQIDEAACRLVYTRP